MKKTGKVYLVGGGPGDPELLTLKAYRILQKADAVVYDRLISDEVLALAPKGASKIYVGKQTNNHTLPQEEISALLVSLAKAGHTVVRLKGGDPFIFGRGSEEALELVRANIEFEVVPGITAAAGASAMIGVPLTHRGLATGVRFVTGHCRADQPLDLDWKSLSDPDTTLVIYMGLANLAQITTQLMAAGLSGSTPVMAVSRATMADQKTCPATLETLERSLKAAGLKSPALIIIGKVASLANVLGPGMTAAGENSDAQELQAMAGE